MPTLPRKPCNKPGCPSVIPGGTTYCDKHRKERGKQKDYGRQSSTARGYGYKWQKVRKKYLIKHPLCVHCDLEGITTSAQVVDHIKPHRGNRQLMWDESNYQSLCKTHHDIKTAVEDGGFGR